MVDFSVSSQFFALVLLSKLLKLMVLFSPGPPDGHRAPGDLLNGQGAGATTAIENAMVQALTTSWRGSVTGRGRRGRAGTEIGTEGTEETEETGRGDDPEAQTETKTDENVEEAAAAAGSEEANVKTKRGTEEMTGARGRTGITTKTAALRGSGLGIKRTGEKLMTGGIKTTGTGTERRGRQKGRVGVEAGRRGTKVGRRRRAGRESAPTAEKGTGIETENSVPTNVVVAKTGAIISESPVMIIVNIANAEGVRALSKCHHGAILLLLLCFSSFFSTQLSSLLFCATENER